jgi:tetratricopeptide (TPR) repeat protein/TolB-like protein
MDRLETPGPQRLDSWKEIAAYLRKDIRTVQLWEKKEGLPVHRHAHAARATVYAYPAELDAWLADRQQKSVTGSNPPLGEVPPAKRRKVLISALLVCLVVGGFLAGAVVYRRAVEKASSPARPTANTPPKVRSSVAVIGFRNLSGKPEEEWISTALTEMLSTELAAGAKLRTIPGEDVAQMKINLSLRDTDSYGRDTLTRIRQNLNVDHVVLGSYLAQGNGEIRLDVRIEDAVTGEITDSFTATGKETDVGNLVTRAGTILREELGGGEPSLAEVTAMQATLPANAMAARLYAEGLAKYRKFEYLAARNYLQKAVAAEPGFALAHSALSDVWRGLGYFPEAKREARKAVDLSKKLSREDQLFVEGRYRDVSHDRDKAIEVYQKLVSLYPDNIDYGLRLGVAQTNAGRTEEAMRTLEALRKAPGAESDPRIELYEAGAAGRLGDYKQLQVVAQRALEKAKVQGAKLLAAEARRYQCFGTQNLGLRNEALTYCAEAQRLYAEAGDRDHVAWVLKDTAWDLMAQGDLVAAKEANEEAISIFREVGDIWGTAETLANSAELFYRQGDFARSAKAYRQALNIYRRIRDKDNAAVAMEGIGNAALSRGDLAEAQGEFENAKALYIEVGDRDSAAGALGSLAEVRYLRGDFVTAKRLNAEAQAVFRETGNKRFFANACFELGKILREEGNLAAAREQYGEALRLELEDGEKEESQTTQVALDELLVEEGHADQAEKLLRKPVEELRLEKFSDSWIWAQSVLVRAELAEGKLKEAMAESENAEKLASESQNLEVRLAIRIAAARVHAALGKTTQAQEALQAALAEAARHGYVGPQFETRLALGEIELHSGQVAAGRAHLAVLEKDASAKGFLLITHKATFMRGGKL